MNGWWRRPGGLLTVVLAVLCAALLVALLLHRLLWRAGPGETAVSVAPREAAPQTDLATREFQLPALDEYAEVTARPLFNEDRRPDPEEEGGEGEPEQEQLAGLEPPPVTLSGVIITPETRVAMLEHNRRNEQLALEQGDTLDGWTLESVEERRIVFASGDALEPVMLEVYTGAAGGGRRSGSREQAAAEEEESRSASELIRERIARERERRRELIERARERNRNRNSDKDN